MPLNDIVNVQITTQTQAVPEQNFGIPLILGANKSFNTLVKQYSDITEVASDFDPEQPEYIAAQAVFAQNPRPDSLFVGRQDVPVVTVTVLSAILNKIYTNTINGNAVTVNSNTVQQVTTLTYSADFVADNLINVVFNNTVLGTITSIIDFDINFVASNSIVATVNSTPLAPVVFLTDQATTIGLLAAAIAGATGVTSATVTDTKQITVVFTNPGANTVDSVITTLGASQPVATIVEGGFEFTTDQATTMALITSAITSGFASTVASAVAVGDVITVTAVAAQSNEFNSSVVFKGVSQPTATIVVDSLAATIAKQMVTNINAFVPDLLVTANYTGTPDGTYTVTADTSTVPYTFEATTNITSTNAAVIKITDARPNATYNLYLGGVRFQYVSPNLVQTVEEIAAAFVALINDPLVTLPVTATDNLDGTFLVESDTAPFTFSVQLTDSLMDSTIGFIVAPYVSSGSIVTRLNDILNVTRAWYALIVTDRTPSVVESVADWAESQTIIFGTASNNATIINVEEGVDMSSIAWYVQNQGYIRTFVLYHQDADDEYPEAAWFGKVLPLDPGSETWKFKTLAGVAYSDLSTTQSNNALNKNANTYEYIGNVGITQNGTSGQGEFLDIVRGVDWLKSTIQTYVYRTLVTLPKVPYTDAGIAAIQAQVQRALQQGIDNNFIANDPAPIVTVPLAANVPSVDKANRILKNVKFTATLAGAIHAVRITGVVTV
jgi:hypothetical protein